MERTQAKIALLLGKRLTHRYFDKDEYIEMDDIGNYVFEDGCKCTPNQFWNTRQATGFDSGWSVR